LSAPDEHDQALLAHVRPRDWRNPAPPARPYQLLVIGGGTAGLVSAVGAASLGARVALVERERLGGDCLNVGCVPSKALIRSARAAADVRAAGAFGVRIASGVSVDFPAVMERMRRLRAELAPNDSAERLRGLGVDVCFGAARFEGAGVVAVGEARLPYRRAVVATGARAAAPPIPGLAQAGYLTNETVFDLRELPPRLAVIGAGPLGCELAQCFARLGARVTLLEAAPRILGRETADAAAAIERALRADGVELLCGVTIREVRARGAEKQLAVEHGGGARTLAADAILIGAGRAPTVAGLGLESVGVAWDPQSGVHVDDFLRTTNPRIFAAGDVCSACKFTHAADAHARIVIQNALFSLGPLGRARASRLTLPWCTYPDPELAHVGLYADEARQRGLVVDTLRIELADVDRAVLDGDPGFLEVLVRRGSDRLLGATLVARHAGETISELGLAMVAGAGLKTLARTLHPYPTQAAAIQRAGDAFNRGRLTPRARRWLALWMRVRG
jgi:pyruvate/2-oxoglutarate dehydrogenase complex dihydrolipoamide dehydrogenase (E3) component